MKHYVVCVRHRILGWLPWPTRWHVHFAKPLERVGSKDLTMLQSVDLGWWWMISTTTEDH